MPILSSRKESKQLVFILNRIGSYCHQLVTSKKQCVEISLEDCHLLPCVWQWQVNCTSGIPLMKVLKDLNHVVIVVLAFQKNSKRNLKVEQTRL